jgi:HEAT repeat protein
MTFLGLVAVLFVVALGSLGAAIVLVARRHHRDRHAEREAAVRTVLFRTLQEPGRSDEFVGGLVPSDGPILEAKARVLLADLKGEDRETLARLLESRGAVAAARRQCRSHRAESRSAACQLLGDAGSAFAVLDLVPLLDDRSLAVRLDAAKALGRLGQPGAVAPLLGAVRGRHPIPVDVVADAIEQIRDCPVSLLRQCMLDPSASARSVGAELLGRLHVLDAIGDLIDVLEGDPAPHVRVRAARALGRLESPRAIRPLLACLESGTPALRAETASALGRLGSPAAIPELRMMLLGPSPRMSELAAQALATIVPQGLAALEDLADDDRHTAAAVARKVLAARHRREYSAAG